MKNTKFVQDIFSSVASKYDIMNDLMSFGMHRVWKNQFAQMLQPFNNGKLLDLAGGTGDIAFRFIDNGGLEVVVCDLNQNMLEVGKAKAIDSGKMSYINQISWICGNAEQLGFENATYDCCSMVFGIRNVEHIEKALTEIYRVLKPKSSFICMEFDNMNEGAFKTIYNLYSKYCIPTLGKVVANDSAAYQYLVNSIAAFPKPEEFETMLKKSGFAHVVRTSVMPAVATIYNCYKL